MEFNFDCGGVDRRVDHRPRFVRRGHEKQRLWHKKIDIKKQKKQSGYERVG
jgi:hypothetical protein